MGTQTQVQRRGRVALVGRQRELGVLRGCFDAAREGHAGVALVAGEPGIGKTHLLDEVAHIAAAHAVVLRGGASEVEGMPPYLPFLEALGRHIRAADAAELRAQAGAAAPLLAAIFPELVARLGDLPSSYALPPEQARLRLFEAIGQFLAAIAAASPLVVILDDLHWADSASLDLLCHVIQHQPAARLLILGAYRDSEVAQNPALGRALAELARLRSLTTVTLTPLSAAETAALAAADLGAPTAPALDRLLYEHSEGNPFFAEELLRGWLEAGVLDRRRERWELVAPPAGALPHGITGAIRQRLARLSPAVLDLLRTAAIVGRQFDVTILADAAGEDGEAVEAWLAEGERVGLIRPVDDDTWTFTHDKIREALYADVTALRRRRLHGFIGRALEVRVAGEQEDTRRLADLAFHFGRSGDRARGVTYAQRAAERARAIYAFEEALAQYRVALELLDTGDARRGALLLALGQTALLTGAMGEAAAAFEAAQAAFVAADDAHLAAQAAHGLGQARWREEAHAPALAAFETALRLLGDRPSPQAVTVLTDLASLLAVSLGRQDEGLSYGRRALDLARQLGEPRLEATASRTVGNLLVRSNAIPAGLPLLERALALAEDADDPAEAAECCSCLSLAYLWHGELRRGLAMIDRRLAHAERCRDLYQLRHAYTWRIGGQIWQGHWAEADQALAQAEAIVERLASPEPLAFLYHIRGSVAWFRGDYATAEALFARAVELFRPLGPSVLVWYLGPLGIAQLAQGKREEALACLNELEGIVAAQPANTIPAADGLTKLALLALGLGDRERGARYYSQLLPFSGLQIDFLVDRLLGELAILRDDLPAAETHLAAAEALARREENTPELASTLAAQATLVLARGGKGSTERARALLEEARALFERFGMAGTASLVGERLRNLPARSPARMRPALPAGLSPREAEVLRLVAAGKSNRQIAEVLYLSEKTVINHLTSIFTKTGADNRAAATAFAVRHGLA